MIQQNKNKKLGSFRAGSKFLNFSKQIFDQTNSTEIKMSPSGEAIQMHGGSGRATRARLQWDWLQGGRTRVSVQHKPLEGNGAFAPGCSLLLTWLKRRGLGSPHVCSRRGQGGTHVPGASQPFLRTGPWHVSLPAVSTRVLACCAL